jgi:hypothetical protein
MSPRDVPNTRGHRVSQVLMSQLHLIHLFSNLNDPIQMLLPSSPDTRCAPSPPCWIHTKTEGEATISEGGGKRRETSEHRQTAKSQPALSLLTVHSGLNQNIDALRLSWALPVESLADGLRKVCPCPQIALYSTLHYTSKHRSVCKGSVGALPVESLPNGLGKVGACPQIALYP